MDALFGLSMTTIMYVLLGIFAVSIASVGLIALRNRHMFKMGLRNLPRRGLQTGLVVLGLMLATLIITAAFTIGDTIDASVTARSYDQWQRTDLNINIRGDESENGIGPEVYVSDEAAAQLQAQFAGDDQIETFMPFLYARASATSSRTNLSEPNISMVGFDPDVMSRAGGYRNVDGGTVDLSTLAWDDALLSERATDELDAQVGDTITLFYRGTITRVHVAAIVKDEQASGVVGDFDDASRPGGIALVLPTVQQIVNQLDKVNYISVALKGDVKSTANDAADAAALRLEGFLDTPDGRAILGTNHATAVEAIKWDDVQQAEEFGNIFTTFFLIVGMFSIAAGIMLIFMIFVMLAAERKAEMGMARAVGATRGNLVQAFVSEGMSYNLIAGAVGAALGVGAAIVLIVGFLRYSLGDDFDFIQAEVTPRSVIISYCLGVSLTFLTVVFASMKVSSVNIVAAIRGTPEDETPEPRKKISWLWVALGIPAMIIPPLGIWFFFRKGFHVSWAWILGPSGIVLGLLSILQANSGGSEFLFSLGFSLLPLSVAIIAAHYRAPARLTWSLIGVYLSAYWLSPVNIGEKILGRELNADIEMFVVSGVMVVVAFTLLIVFNARLLTLLFQGENGNCYRVPALATVAAAVSAAVGLAMGDTADGLGQLLYLLAGLLAIVAFVSFAAVRFPRLAPALKMGVAYPLSNRFRTGMTIAMFSLIIFSLTVFSAVNANFLALASGEDGDGGWDVVATASDGTSTTDLRDELADSPIAADIEATGGVTTFVGQQEVRQDGVGDFETYPVIAMNDDFLAEGTKLDSFADGYGGEQGVLDAVRANPDLALVDVTATEDWDTYDWSADITKDGDTLEPFQATFREPVTGTEHTVTVVGIWANRLTPKDIAGLYVNADAYRMVFGEPTFNREYIRLADGTNAKEAARAIEAELGTRGVQAESIRELISDSQAQSQAFTRVFQAFMALGLFVGIAALGVIAFRSVVERRQQIGMLRAIGYQTESIALTFVLESTFVALMGILSGVVGGVIISRNLFTTGQFSGEGVDFTMPWAELLVFVSLAFVVSLLMTWIPSRNAARVPVADALRYE